MAGKRNTYLRYANDIYPFISWKIFLAHVSHSSVTFKTVVSIGKEKKQDKILKIL